LLPFVYFRLFFSRAADLTVREVVGVRHIDLSFLGLVHEIGLRRRTFRVSCHLLVSEKLVCAVVVDHSLLRALTLSELLS
jgi:hypothetical protein